MSQVQETEEPQRFEYYLTIVTSRVYTLQRFVKEAERLGVNRTVPADILRHVEWQDPVLLADWRGVRRMVVKKGKAKETFAMPGNLSVFGYFTVDSVVPQGFSDEAHKKFVNSLDVAGEVAPGGPVSRACGSYTDGGGYWVRDSIAQIVETAEAIAATEGVKLKWFMGGRFRQIPIILMDSCVWTLGYRKIKTETKIEPGTEKLQTVKFVDDYVRRRSLKKIDAERLDGVQAGLA